MKFCVLNIFISCILCYTLVGCQRRGNPEYSSRTSIKQTRSYYSPYSATPLTTQKPSQTTRSSGYVGAWGYVAIILTVILSGLGVYYFVIFYPIVCKKERMYDVMEMTAV